MTGSSWLLVASTLILLGLNLWLAFILKRRGRHLRAERDELMTRLSRAEHERETLRTALERETEIVRAKTKLFATISHEIRTPLASMVGLAEILLLREYSKVERQQYLRLLIDESRRLTSLIDEHFDRQRDRSESREIHGDSPPQPTIATVERYPTPST